MRKDASSDQVKIELHEVKALESREGTLEVKTLSQVKLYVRGAIDNKSGDSRVHRRILKAEETAKVVQLPTLRNIRTSSFCLRPLLPSSSTSLGSREPSESILLV